MAVGEPKLMLYLKRFMKRSVNVEVHFSSERDSTQSSVSNTASIILVSVTYIFHNNAVRSGLLQPSPGFERQ